MNPLTPEQWLAFASGFVGCAILATGVCLFIIGRLQIAHRRERLQRAQAHIAACARIMIQAEQRGYLRAKGYPEPALTMTEVDGEEATFI